MPGKVGRRIKKKPVEKKPKGRSFAALLKETRQPRVVGLRGDEGDGSNGHRGEFTGKAKME